MILIMEDPTTMRMLGALAGHSHIAHWRMHGAVV